MPRSTRSRPELRSEPTPSDLGYGYLRRIHTRMSARIVPNIAGKLRDVDVQAVGAGIPYCRPAYIASSLGSLFDRLAMEDYLLDWTLTLASRLADPLGGLPFTPSAMATFEVKASTSPCSRNVLVIPSIGSALTWISYGPCDCTPSPESSGP